MEQIESLFLSAAIVLAVLYITRPRRFYFVRHGETLLNAQHIRQGSEGALSEKGREQADQVGQSFKGLSIQTILVSTYPRAQETAGIINKYLHVPIIPSPLFAERKNPTEIIGKSTKDPEVERIVEKIDLAYHEDDYRYSDEENFAEMRMRAHKCIDLLAHQGARGVVVVTHHQFLKMLIAYMLYRDQLHAGDFIKLSFFNISDNAGITVCEYHPLKMFSKTRGWEVVSYNEQPA